MRIQRPPSRLYRPAGVSAHSSSDTGSTRLARVPLGAYVTNCSIVDDRFAYCEYNGYAGYILLDNLTW